MLIWGSISLLKWIKIKNKILFKALCQPNPCQNGGLCNIIQGNGAYGMSSTTFQCICPPNYTGTTCTFSIATTPQPTIPPST